MQLIKDLFSKCVPKHEVYSHCREGEQYSEQVKGKQVFDFTIAVSQRHTVICRNQRREV